MSAGALGVASPPRAATLVAMGIVSAPEYLERREACRASWLRSPNVGRGRALSVHFVVRALHAPASIDQLLRLEHAAHGDVLRVDVPWNETRLRGPVLSVAAWLTYAVRELASARFVAKLDDDAFVYAPGLEAVVREAMRVAPSPDRIYMGPMSWFHWYPKIFERSGFGWSYTMSWSMGRHCRNVTSAEERCLWRGCGPCMGPFPFASGFLALLSTPLAAELLSGNGDTVRDDDLKRLRAATVLPTRTGGVQVKVMEDIWVGSLLHRKPPARPISYVALSEKDDKTLVADGCTRCATERSRMKLRGRNEGLTSPDCMRSMMAHPRSISRLPGGLRVAKSALVVHLKNHQSGKQLERFLAVDDFMRREACGETLVVSCTSGCKGFLTEGERWSLERNARFGSEWGARLESEAFCSGTQRGAAYCRVGAKPPRNCPKKPIDLLQDQPLWATVAPRAAELLRKTREMAAEAQLQGK